MLVPRRDGGRAGSCCCARHCEGVGALLHLLRHGGVCLSVCMCVAECVTVHISVEDSVNRCRAVCQRRFADTLPGCLTPRLFCLVSECVCVRRSGSADGGLVWFTVCFCTSAQSCAGGDCTALRRHTLRHAPCATLRTVAPAHMPHMRPLCLCCFLTCLCASLCGLGFRSVSSEQ